MFEISKSLFKTCFCLSLTLILLKPSIAADYTPWAVPTMIEVVSGGVVIYGAFGNENGCTRADMILYPNTYTDYEVVVSMALAAISAGREMRFYSSECTTFFFHGGTLNRAYDGQAVYLR